MALIFDPLSGLPASPQLIGGKAFALWQLDRAGFRVPAWFAVTVDATAADLENDDSALQKELSAMLQRHGLTDSALAVRSSATVEDGSARSFAGQFESILGVRADETLDAIRRVRASAESFRVRHYQSGMTDSDPIAMAVIVQQLVDAEISGVAFGADPLSGDADTVVVSATLGLGDRLVQGDVDADTFTWRAAKIATVIVNKPTATRRRPEGGTIEVPVPVEVQDAPSLASDQIEEIVAAVQSLNRHFGHPQDVEWAFADGALHILQSRPITTLPTTAIGVEPAETIAPPEGGRIVWDNSNIVESYSGVTTPLTFSFVSDVYTQVYQEFCRILGVDEETLADNRGVFTMLGMIDGRIYYNLLNWHRLLALLPGYRINAKFMEQMMGVRERVEETPTIVPPRSNPYIRLGVSLFRLLQNLFTLRSSIRDFHALVDAELLPLDSVDLGTRSGEELLGLYRRLEARLLRRWRVPILNDFYTMIFHGMLNSSIAGLDPDAPGNANDLLAGSGGIVSTEPMRLLRAIADGIDSDRSLLDGVRGSDDVAAWHLIVTHPATSAPAVEYLRRFGDRTAGELKLETITGRQRPELIMGQIRAYMNAPARDESGGTGADLAARAERDLFTRLSGHPLTRLKIRLLLSQARTRVRERENLRFERTRVFGVVRRILLALGEHLHRLGQIDEPRDVFMLTKEEIFSAVDGTSVTTSLRDLVALRGAEQREHFTLDPADRFETFGFPLANPPSTRRRERVDGDGTTLRGTACCRGRIVARVRIVTDPLEPGELSGRIMVAERTDPGWGPLFPLAAGLLVERGSLLSHSAIVAREMNIPAIVSIPGLLATLRDGELVEMDGATGEIIRLEHNAAAAPAVVESSGAVA